MVFSSLLFLFYFLPLVLLLYFITPKKYRNLTLLISSLFFYAWGEPKYIVIMLFSSLVDYTCGRQVHAYKMKEDTHKARLWLLVSIIINLGLLCFFKYSDFIISNINILFKTQIPLLNLVLPIGISFYTFQTMSYTIDVYRGDTQVQNNLISFATYVTLFPQLIAGPIVRYQTVSEEIDHRTESIDLFSQGIQRFMIGLGKKVLLANSIGLVWHQISQTNLNQIPTLTAWIGMVAFALQIYFDFSGYSDMAIGMGKMFGFTFLENFNYPYTSLSITDFWRNWHISLGTWFKEYVYIPLGGNRKGPWKTLRNIMIVWALTGIWHGASWNFLFWGVYFGFILIIEKLFLGTWLKKRPRWLQRVYTLLLVLISWVIFAFDSLNQGLSYLRIMFNPLINGFANGESIYFLYTNLLLFFILLIAATSLPKNIWQDYQKKHPQELLSLLLLGFLFFLVVANLVDQTYNPFLYFRF